MTAGTSARSDAIPIARILVASCGTGAGHNVAAEALVEAGRRHFGDRIRIEWMDLLGLAPLGLGELHRATHNVWQNLPKGWWGLAYRRGKRESPRSASRRLLGAVTSMLLRPFARILAEKTPDAVICTHPYAVDAVGRLLGSAARRPKCCAVVTDLLGHPYWIGQGMDVLFVPTAECKDLLEPHLGSIPAEITGIPIHPDWEEPAVCGTADLLPAAPAGAPVAAIMNSGHASRRLLTLARTLQRSALSARFVLVAGRNARLKERLRSELAGDPRFRVVGFVPQILRKLAPFRPLLATRPGGLTCAEALCADAAVILYDADPGQEFDNAAYLVDRGAATWARDDRTLFTKLAAWLANPSEADAYRSRARMLALPTAARNVLTRALAHLTVRRGDAAQAITARTRHRPPQ